MADYCVLCHNKIYKDIEWMLRDQPWEYVLEYGICEGCGKYRDDIVVDLNPSLLRRFVQKRKYQK